MTQFKHEGRDKVLRRIPALLMIPAILISFAGEAQESWQVCDLQIRQELIKRLGLQSICDHYLPQTGPARAERLQSMKKANPACYEALSSDPELKALVSDMPGEISNNEQAGERDSLRQASNDLIKDFYVKECESLTGDI